MTVHHAPLKSGYAKVSVDTVSKHAKDVKLPVPASDLTKLGDTEGTTIQWPEAWIEPFERVFFQKFLFNSNHTLMNS